MLLELGKRLVADPKICRGQPTFRGTRILVANVLEQVASGTDWQSIIESSHGRLDQGDIAEALRVAAGALAGRAGHGEMGKYVVADPNICHGQPTFRGTRIFVVDILEQLAMGLDWRSIIEDWRSRIDREAIADAVRAAAQALLEKTEKRRAS
jgi:uncharacterized protein (DUF433 family)